ncbi:MAG: hypothetical protein ABSB42_07930 [Tepidisphaeraceae bacterium]|jgi:hypothetical protein
MSLPLLSFSPVVDPVAQGIQNLTLQINRAFSQLQSLLNTGAALVWNNPSGATPQQVVSTMGTNAAAIFQLSGILTSSVLTPIVGSTVSIMPPGWSYVTSADGTVTLTAPSTSTSTSTSTGT